MTQPEALRLADALDELDRQFSRNGLCGDAAAELRRLSEIETLYLAAMRGRHAMSEELLALTAQRDALLEALKLITRYIEPTAVDAASMQKAARAAIKQAEENT